MSYHKEMYSGSNDKEKRPSPGDEDDDDSDEWWRQLTKNYCT